MSLRAWCEKHRSELVQCMAEGHGSTFKHMLGETARKA
jgi:hypothetical protein